GSAGGGPRALLPGRATPLARRARGGPRRVPGRHLRVSGRRPLGGPRHPGGGPELPDAPDAPRGVNPPEEAPQPAGAGAGSPDVGARPADPTRPHHWRGSLAGPPEGRRPLARSIREVERSARHPSRLDGLVNNPG